MMRLIKCIVLSMFFAACTKQAEDVQVLYESDQTISIDVDKRTNIYTNTIQYFEENGRSFIALENNYGQVDASIDIYSLDSCRLDSRVPVRLDGSLGFSAFSGFCRLSADSYVLGNHNVLKYRFVNSDGVLCRTIDHSEDSLGRIVLSSLIETFISSPFVMRGEKIYCRRPIPLTRWNNDLEFGNNFEFSECPVCAVLDTATNEYVELPAKYPILYSKDDNVHSEHCSWTTCDGDFVYGFLFSDSIYVANESHDMLKAYYAGSKYVSIDNKRYSRSLSMSQSMLFADRESQYGNLLYDEYNDVYYRFVHWPTDVKEVQPDEYRFCRKEFSIIVMDKDFNILGEECFPAGKYAPMLFFINKDGLWLSENNYERTDMTEDKLVFRCLKLNMEL